MGYRVIKRHSARLTLQILKRSEIEDVDKNFRVNSVVYVCSFKEDLIRWLERQEELGFDTYNLLIETTHPTDKL